MLYTGECGIHSTTKKGLDLRVKRNRKFCFQSFVFEKVDFEELERFEHLTTNKNSKSVRENTVQLPIKYILLQNESLFSKSLF